MAGNKREGWLDGLKGLGMLLVLLGHVLSGYLDAGMYPEAYVSFYHVRTWIYYFHMPLFFLISGFTFTLAYWKGGGVRWRGILWQMFNLLWIYVVFALLQWAVKQAVPELVNESYDLERLRHMFTEPLGNFWYIYVLLIFYALAALTRTPDWGGLWLLMPMALAIWAADVHLDWYSLTGYRIVYHFFFFALGCALCRRRRIIGSGKLAGVSAMWLGAAAYFYWFWSIRSWYGYWKVGIAAAASFLLLGLFYRSSGGGKFLRLCGKHCLEIYLLHTFFTAGLRTLLPALGITGPWISVWLNFALSLGVCLLVSFLAGKAKWTDILFRPSRLIRRIKEKADDR